MGTTEYGSINRDLDLARKAYGSRDINLSRMAHEQRAAEGHRVNGDFIKSIVYGGLDGILTMFAILSGAAGGNLPLEAIVVLGVSNLVADALSMGVGDAVSTVVFREHVSLERKREEWEFENYPEGEIEEMVDLYEARGLPREKARVVVETMSKYKEFFIDVMMCQELKLAVPANDEVTAYKEGLVTFTSFSLFGSLPLMCYLLPPMFIELNSSQLFFAACIVTMLVLFLLGACKSYFSSKTWYRSGIEFTLIGSTAAALSYFVGKLVATIISH